MKYVLMFILETDGMRNEGLPAGKPMARYQSSV